MFRSLACDVFVAVMGILFVVCNTAGCEDTRTFSHCLH